MSSTETEILNQLRTVHRRVALWYYLAVAYGWIVVQAGFLVLLIPKITDNYDGMDIKLPQVTKTLVAASDWMAGHNPGQSMPGWMIAVPLAFIVLTLSAVIFRRVTILLALIPILAIASLIGELFLLVAPLYQLSDTLTQ